MDSGKSVLQKALPYGQFMVVVLTGTLGVHKAIETFTTPDDLGAAIVYHLVDMQDAPQGEKTRLYVTLTKRLSCKVKQVNVDMIDKDGYLHPVETSASRISLGLGEKQQVVFDARIPYTAAVGEAKVRVSTIHHQCPDGLEKFSSHDAKRKTRVIESLTTLPGDRKPTSGARFSGAEIRKTTLSEYQEKQRRKEKHIGAGTQ